MKKTILLVGCLTVLTIGIISISCKKDKDKNEAKGCICTSKYGEDSEVYSAEKMKELGYTKCSQIPVASSWTCSER